MVSGAYKALRRQDITFEDKDQALRDDDPVHHVPDNGEEQDYWVLSRFGHVLDAVVDAGAFSSARRIPFSSWERWTWRRWTRLGR